MKTRTTKKNKVSVITLGCSKNTYDSEVLMKQLEANNYKVYHNPLQSSDESKIVIINTCGFIDNAKQESINTILEYAKKKHDGEIEKLIVTGCLSERYKPELQKEIADVDEFFGTHDLPYLLKTLNADYKHELIGERVLTTPKHFAYFKISEGCDRPCSFCAIPIMRGGHVSTPIEALAEQAKHLAADGVKELILIAQDLTFYGLDIYGKRSLAELLRRISDTDGIEWIRLHYAFPQGFPEDVLDVMRERNNICNYLDIPLQHINDRILSSMKRGTTKQRTNDLIKKIRDKVPGTAIRTTLITGYPGETKEEFLELKEWVAEQKFERLGVFTYSHEENTSAYEHEDDVSAKIKQKRADEIMKLQKDISLEHNKKLIGRTLKVIFDKKEGSYFIGRTEHDSPEVDNYVLVDANENYIRLGSFAYIEITSCSEYDLVGRKK